MFRETKMMTISFLIIFMLLPFVGDVLSPWIPAVCVAAGGLVAGVALGRGKNIFAPMRFHQEFLMLAAAVLSFAMEIMGKNGVFGTAEMDRGSVFVYFGVAAMLFYVMRAQEPIRMTQFDLVFYIGSGMLLLYLVSYAIAVDMLLVPSCIIGDKNITNAIGIVNGMIAMWGFCREKDRIRRVMYCAGGMLALLVAALNDTPGILLLFLAGQYAFLVTVPPGADYIKRGLLLFTGSAFLVCNLSLIVGFTKLFKVDGLSYSLRGSVLAELILSLFMLYVLNIWDKLKENGELNKVGLSMLQKKLQRLAVRAGKLFLVFLIFCGIHLWVGLDRFMVLFFEERWEEMQDGLIVSVLRDWVLRLSGVLEGLWKGNVFARCYHQGGAAGLVLCIVVMAWILRRVWESVRMRKNMRLTVIVCGEIFALLFLMPASVELIPFYAVWIYLVVCDLQPKVKRQHT